MCHGPQVAHALLPLACVRSLTFHVEVRNSNRGQSDNGFFRLPNPSLNSDKEKAYAFWIWRITDLCCPSMLTVRPYWVASSSLRVARRGQLWWATSGFFGVFTRFLQFHPTFFTFYLPLHIISYSHLLILSHPSLHSWLLNNSWFGAQQVYNHTGWCGRSGARALDSEPKRSSPK